jgi:multiple sugar transport system substrate-binding protein
MQSLGTKEGLTMRKRTVWQIVIGLVLVAALAIPLSSCVGTKTATTTTSTTTTATTATTTASTSTTTTTTATTPPATTRAAGWSLTLSDIPAVSEKTPINIAMVQDVGGELMLPYVEQAAQKMGVTINHEFIPADLTYDKLNPILTGGQTTYDVINPSSSLTNQWSPYLYGVKELADKYEPGLYTAVMVDMVGNPNALTRSVAAINSNLYGQPYATFTNVMFYRQDVFDNQGERDAFKAKYGYDLAPANTWEQLLDQGEFFTRKAGDQLKGQTLEKDIYGLDMMPNAPDIAAETYCILQSLGTDWMTALGDSNGALIGFDIRKTDRANLVKAMEIYRQLLSWSPPAALTATVDDSVAQFAAGNLMVLPAAWGEQWAVVYKVADNVPGARLNAMAVPGGRPYFGCYYNAVVKTSRNPEAAYWLMRYLGSKDVQVSAAENGWNSSRTDVIGNKDNRWTDAKWDSSMMNPDLTSVTIAEWTTQYQYMDQGMYWNSDTVGRLNAIQVPLLQKAANGELSSAEAERQIHQAMADAQTRYGSVTCDLDPL